MALRVRLAGQLALSCAALALAGCRSERQAPRPEIAEPAIGDARNIAENGSASREVASARALTAGGAGNASDVPVRARPLPALEHVQWVEQLPLEAGKLAYVMPPVGAREPRPLIVAIHGAGDRADWACGGWRLAASEYAFVVCPQGLPLDKMRFAWDSSRSIEQGVEIAVRAVRARFGAYIAEGPTLYVGFSQGATLAGPVLLAVPGRFPVVALAEGGYGLLRDRAFLNRLHDNGTSRLMIVCGSAGCFQTAKAVAPNIANAGINCLIAGDPKAGHNLNLQMQTALRAAWPGFVADLPNWQGFADYMARRAAPVEAQGTWPSSSR